MKREKLFYELYLTIKEVAQNADFSFDKNEWFKNLYGKIMAMDDNTLDIVLDTFSRLNNYSYYNISFIILQSEKLESIFYQDGKFIEENLVLLRKPYDYPLFLSAIITKFCFINNIPIDEFNRFLLLKNEVEILEKIIQEREKVDNNFVINNLDFFFDIYKYSPKFASVLNLGPLHNMQITIYERTKKEDADSQRLKYRKYLSKYTSKGSTQILNKVIDYITNCEFVEYETVEFIGAADIECLDELISKYGKEKFFKKVLSNKTLKRLSKVSPKFLMSILDSHLDDDSSNKLNEIAKNFSDLTSTQMKAIENFL